MSECEVGLTVCCLRVGCVKHSSENVTASGTNAKCVGIELIATAGGILTRTLPPAADWPGRLKAFKKTDAAANTATIAAAGGENIEGAASVALANQYDLTILLSNGSTIYRFGGNV